MSNIALANLSLHHLSTILTERLYYKGEPFPFDPLKLCAKHPDTWDREVRQTCWEWVGFFHLTTIKKPTRYPPSHYTRINPITKEEELVYGIPRVRFAGKYHGVASIMVLALTERSYKHIRRICPTQGCVNPTHYMRANVSNPPNEFRTTKRGNSDYPLWDTRLTYMTIPEDTPKTTVDGVSRFTLPHYPFGSSPTTTAPYELEFYPDTDPETRRELIKNYLEPTEKTKSLASAALDPNAISKEDEKFLKGWLLSEGTTATRELQLPVTATNIVTTMERIHGEVPENWRYHFIEYVMQQTNGRIPVE